MTRCGRCAGHSQPRASAPGGVCDTCILRLARLSVDLGQRMSRLKDQETRYVVGQTVSAWATHFSTMTQETVPGQWDLITEFLLRHVRSSRNTVDAVQACDELTHALALAPR